MSSEEIQVEHRETFPPAEAQASYWKTPQTKQDFKSNIVAAVVVTWLCNTNDCIHQYISPAATAGTWSCLHVFSSIHNLVNLIIDSINIISPKSRCVSDKYITGTQLYQ